LNPGGNWFSNQLAFRYQTESFFRGKLALQDHPFFHERDWAWGQGVQRAGVTDLLDTFSLEYKKYSMSVRMLKNIELFVARGAHKIVVPSKYLKKIVTNWGVASEKITVIYNAFDEPSVVENKEELRVELGFSGPVMVSAGRLVPWKGFDTLISLMPKVLKEFPETKLVIAGEGPYREHLELAARSTGVPENIIFTGKLEQKELFKYIKASDLFVLNTSYEGFSHQILEVLSLGTPIITTAVGGNGEVIKNGENGILVSYNDEGALLREISSLLTDREKAVRLAENGKKTIKDFSEERMLSTLTEILNT
jgi:glycosyltransferase involved in cell wall biosynthesis